VTQIDLSCNPVGLTEEISVPPNEFALALAVVKNFDPSEYSEVKGIRTTASSSELSTIEGHRTGSPAVVSAALSLSVDSSPPPGSNMPVLNLSIHAV
jgi:hypothetical protein